MSRGSELALLAGALLEPIGPVVAFAPSGVCWAGLGPRGPLDAPAWRFRGDDIPCAGMHSGGMPLPPPTPGSAIALRPYHEAFLADPATIRPAEIPVEQVKGPILMISGEADEMWPATDLAQIAERRAADRGFPYQLTHRRYPDAGHMCAGVPGTPVASEMRHPLTGQVYSLGGTPAANAQARADSWPRVLQWVLEGSAAR
jgi:pimeloyl-ACP methyl ester carboxylesterase